MFSITVDDFAFKLGFLSETFTSLIKALELEKFGNQFSRLLDLDTSWFWKNCRLVSRYNERTYKSQKYV